MSLSLYLIRHAETEEKKPGQTDLTRELTLRGEKDAKELGRVLKERKILFDVILSSPATRTQATALLLMETIGLIPANINVIPILYSASPDAMLSIIKNLPDEQHSVALIGHNPGISIFARLLLKDAIDNFSQGTLAAINFQVSKWSEVQMDMGHIIFIKSPSIS
jgi:phosphohistidine phosphatase